MYQEMNQNNTNFLSRNFFYYDGPTKLFMQIWCIIVITCGVMGNGTVLLVFLTKWRTVKWSDLFVIGLAIGDFAESIQSPLLWMYNISGWSYHSVGKCKTIWFIGCVCLYSSALFLITVSIDRYIAVKRPFKDRDRNTKRMAIITCIVTIAIGIFYLFGDRVGLWNTGDEHWICFINRTQNDLFADVALIEFLIQVIFPLFTMAVLYSMMFYELRKSTNGMNQYMSPAERSRRRRSEFRTSMTLLMTVSSFLITITPLRLFAILDVYNILPNHDYNAAYPVMACFSMINPCLNPFLYGRLQSTFRNEIAHIIRRLKNLVLSNDYLGLRKGRKTSEDTEDLRKNRFVRQGTIDSSTLTSDSKRSIDRGPPFTIALDEEERKNAKQNDQSTNFKEPCRNEVDPNSTFYFSDRETDL